MSKSNINAQFLSFATIISVHSRSVINAEGCLLVRASAEEDGSDNMVQEHGLTHISLPSLLVPLLESFCHCNCPLTFSPLGLSIH